MKKIMALILTVTVFAALFTGCTGVTVVVGDCTCPDGGSDWVPVEGAVKTGLSVSVKVADSISATADNSGAAKYDVTLAAVAVDGNGVIVDCCIDSIAATVEFDSNGRIAMDLSQSVQTKNELGENYGMVAWGGAVAEWDAQVAALCQYAVGKTVDQLKNGDIDMTTGMAKDGTDLSTSATIYLAGYVYAIEAAVNNAQYLGAQAGDELVLTTINSVKNSTSASADKAGNAQLDVDIVALTRRDGVITSCYLDSAQAKIAFDACGNITTDLTAEVQTKNQLGENYGMVAWGGAKAEWNEQAAAFAAYVTGKTAEQVSGIAVTESSKPADGTDLSSSVTIGIGSFMALIAKAMQ